jgi:hypothetical protein
LVQIEVRVRASFLLVLLRLKAVFWVGEKHTR